MLLLVLLLPYSSLCGKIVEYRFGQSIGPKFFDFSYNNRHAYVESTSKALSTDRGVYLDGGENKITVTTFKYTPISTIIMWIKAKTRTGVILIHGFDNNSQKFIFSRTSNSFRLQVLGHHAQDSQSSSNAIQNDEWILVKILYHSSGFILTAYPPSSINPSINIYMHTIDFFYLGGLNSEIQSLKLFYWYFAIITEDVDLSTFYSSESGTCLTNFCETCNYSFIDPQYNRICLSTYANENENSNKTECEGNWGCSVNSTLNCTCSDYCFINFVSNDLYCSNNPNSVPASCEFPEVQRGNKCCNSICSSCSDPEVCLGCIDPNGQAVNGTCKCSDSFWGVPSSNSTSSCNSCPIGCLTCTNNTLCNSCNSDYTRIIEGLCFCEEGYFNQFPNTGLVCESCGFGCRFCENFSKCSECFNPLASIVNGECQCSKGFFPDPSDSDAYKCSACSNDCLHCSSLTDCIECKDRFSTSDYGKCTCIQFFYGNASQDDPCKAECGLACSGCISKNECSSCLDSNAEVLNKRCVCKDGYFLNSDEISCSECQGGCSKCSSSGTCQNCFDIQATPGDKQCECQEGYYGIPSSPLYSNDSRCLKCDLICKACSDYNYCTSCPDKNSEALNGICQCKEKFFFNNSTKKCQPCQVDCRFCEDETFCLECNSLHSFIHPFGGCQCEEQFYNETRLTSQNSCKKCHFRCKNCKNDKTCEKCLGNNTRMINGECRCLPGYYFSLNSSVDCQNCLSFKESDSCRLECGKARAWHGFKCVDCPKFCLNCDDSLNCLDCDNGMKVSQGLCVCLKGQDLVNEICQNKYFELEIAVLSNNTLHFQFSEELELMLNESAVDLSIFGEEKLLKIVEVDRNRLMVSMKNVDFFNVSTPFSIYIDSPVYSANNSQLLTYEYFGNFPASPPTAFAQAVKSTIKGIMASSFASGMMSNPASCWVLINTIQVIIYLPLCPLKYSMEILEFLQALAGYSIVPNILELFFDAKASSKPIDRVQRVGLTSTVFWVNIGPSAVILIVYIALLPFAFVGSKLPYISETCLNFLKNFRYSIFIRFWIEVYLEAGIFALIQIQSTLNSKDIGYFSFFTATVIIVKFIQMLVLLTPIYTAFLLFKLSRNVQNSVLNERLGTLLSEFKLNKGFFSYLFYLVFFCRRLQYILTQTLLFEFPYVQFFLNIVFAVLQLVYIIVYRPFKEKAVMVSEFVGEVCVVLVIAISGFMLPDQKPVNYIISKIFIYLIIGCISFQTLISMYSLSCMIKELVNKYKKYKVEKVIKKSQKVHPEKSCNTTQDLNEVQPTISIIDGN